MCFTCALLCLSVSFFCHPFRRSTLICCTPLYSFHSSRASQQPASVLTLAKPANKVFNVTCQVASHHCWSQIAMLHHPCHRCKNSTARRAASTCISCAHTQKVCVAATAIGPRMDRFQTDGLDSFVTHRTHVLASASHHTHSLRTTLDHRASEYCRLTTDVVNTIPPIQQNPT